NCFKMIDWLPENAIRWMGAQGLHHAHMGDPGEVGGYMGGAAALVERQIVGAAGELARKSGLAGAGATLSSPQGQQFMGHSWGLAENRLGTMISVAGQHGYLPFGMGSNNSAGSNAANNPGTDGGSGNTAPGETTPTPPVPPENPPPAASTPAAPATPAPGTPPAGRSGS
ncbi:MAG: hypothetical protein AB7H77_11650, partial [Bdellovibrionales bacterium]